LLIQIESKDPHNFYLLIALERFFTILFVKKPGTALLIPALSGSFGLRSLLRSVARRSWHSEKLLALLKLET